MISKALTCCVGHYHLHICAEGDLCTELELRVSFGYLDY